MLSLCAHAQTEPAPQVVLASNGEGQVAVMPRRATPPARMEAIEGLQVEVGVEGGLLVHRARYQGQTHTAYAQLEGPERHLAFNPQSRRFEEVSSSLLIRLASDGHLETVIEASGAVGGKAYPALGWALLQLPAEVNPATVAQTLQSSPLVEGARLILQDDFAIPQRVPAPPSLARSTPTPGGQPLDAKQNVAPDLLGFFGDVVIGATEATIDARVWNWGGASSTATELVIAINDQPDWSESVLWLGRGEVPALDPKTGLAYSFDIALGDFAPGRDYYAILQVEEIPEEHPRRRFNLDLIGLSLDASGAVRLRCQAPTSGTAVAGADDPLVGEQWHLVNSGQAAFAAQPGVPGEDLAMQGTLQDGPTGRGVRVAVVDTGLEVCHPDLAANIETGASHNFNVGYWTGASNRDPYQPSSMGDHGTSVAGVIAAAANNGIGGRGVASNAMLRGYNLLSANDWTGAWVDALGGSSVSPNSAEVDIFNLSFGGLGREGNPDPDTDVALYQNGVNNLRGGLGAIYVKSAGNGFRRCGSIPRTVNEQIGCISANGDPDNNLPYLIVVGGFNAAGKRASYSSAGANLWISAPSGEYGVDFPAIITTDQIGLSRGYDQFIPAGLALDGQLNPYGHYVSDFNGTSAAAPNVSGAIALLLEAHPDLTWRDVKHVLAKTARRIDPDISAVRYGFGGAAHLLQQPWADRSAEDRARNWYGFGPAPYMLQLPWVVNAAGYSFHNWYGFGALALDDALAYAASHQADGLGPLMETASFAVAEEAAIPDYSSSGLTQALDVSGLPADSNIEALTLTIDVTHPFTNDLGIHLISPSGTESVLNPVFNDFLANNQDLDWQLLSNAFYGERPNGSWTLKVVDAAPGDAGELNGWSLRFALGTHPGQ
ncbi:MAG: S8 family peptidase [Gammaproteobacteria bacterium]|nr:S8 family peptidase [Gammaproteobacteria bacterium]